ncbi:MAG TPA: DUF5320 domain-containing protein [bacterium]|nr:DUF5320 domain-containing protein [bacterium]
MPGGDRTGPLGWGPGTSRGAGYCAGYDALGFVSGGGFRSRVVGFDRGFWRRGGGGRGWRNRYFATGRPGWRPYGYPAAPPGAYSTESERQTLQSEAEALQAELDAIKQRLETIEKPVEE